MHCIPAINKSIWNGIQVGNAVTDNYYDNLGTVTYWWSHAMISDKTYRQLINTCDFRRQKESVECESLYSYAMDQEFGNIDQYNIYAPPCNNSDGSTSTHQSIRLPHHPYKVCVIRVPIPKVILAIVIGLTILSKFCQNPYAISLGLIPSIFL